MLFDRTDLGGDYEEVHLVQDDATGLRAVIALHSTRRGPATGGIRRMHYPTDEAALLDALRLAAMMTAKCALADLPAGGGKAVILADPMRDRAGAYAHLARAIDRLGGRYHSGPDVGTNDDDLAIMRKHTAHVNAPGNDAGAATAAGVLAGLRGVLAHLDGSPDAAGRTLIVQGLGAVGLAVARGLLAQGAKVLATDVRPEAVEAAQAIGCEPLLPDLAMRTACDVFVPCALGGILDAQTARSIPARAICGSANNQLADAEAGTVLAARGIPYAPDFVVNAGAVIEGVYAARDGDTDATRQRAHTHIARIERTTRDILATARKEARPTHDVAMALARGRLG